MNGLPMLPMLVLDWWDSIGSLFMLYDEAYKTSVSCANVNTP